MTFTASRIEAEVPARPGLYRIYRAAIGKPDVVIYVEDCFNLRKRLLDHCERKTEQSDCIWRHGPTDFICQVGRPWDVRMRTELLWIQKYQPLCT